MIDFKIDGATLHHGAVMGNGKMIVAEVCQAIALIYSGVAKSDPEAAEDFKRLMRRAINDEQSPVWDGDTARQGIFMTRRKKRKGG